MEDDETPTRVFPASALWKQAGLGRRHPKRGGGEALSLLAEFEAIARHVLDSR